MASFCSGVNRANKQAHNGFEVGHARKIKQFADNGVVTRDLCVFKPIGSTPNRDHQVCDEPLGRMAPIAPKRAPVRFLPRTTKAHVVKPALEQAQTGLGSDFLVAKSEFVGHSCAQK